MCLLHVLLSIAILLAFPCCNVYFSIQKYLFLLHLFLSNKGWFRNRLSVVWVKSTACYVSATELVLHGSLFLVKTALNLAVGLAVEYHLVPGIVLFEDTHDVLVVEILNRTWVLKRSVLKAIVLKLLLVCLCYTECLQCFLILQLKTCLGSAILQQA